MHRTAKYILQLKNDEQKSEAWLESRVKMLTASDVAASIGIKSNGVTPRELVLRKCGIKKFSGNVATRHGEYYEDKAREIYEKLYNTKVLETGLCVHPDQPWLGGSPDGVTIDGILIEIKCPWKRVPKENEIPEHYIPQVLVCLETLDLEMAHFIEYVPPELRGGEEIFYVTRIARDREWFTEKLPVMRDFWEKMRICQDDNDKIQELFPGRQIKKKKTIDIVIPVEDEAVSKYFD